jgi:MFS transporter, DHA1 family, multidrug resistance protein
MEGLSVELPAVDLAKRVRLQKILLGAVAFLYWFCLYVYVPTLPVYVQSKVQNLALVGGVLSMYGFWQLVSRLPTGFYVDRLGERKPAIAAGLLIVGAGAVLMGLASNVTGLTIGRALTGVGAGAWVPLLVLFTMLFPPEQMVRATGILTLIQTLGRILGSGSTGFLNQLGGYNLAFQIAGGAAVVGVAILLFLPEKKDAKTPPSVASLARIFLKPEVLVPTFLSILLHYADQAASFAFVPIQARAFGASDIFLSGLSSANLICVLIGNVLVSTFGGRVSTRVSIGAGFAVLLAGLAAAALAPSLWVLAGGQALIGLAYGLLYPVLVSASIRYVAENERSTAIGLHTSGYALGMFAGPWLGGLLANALGIQPMFGVSAAAILILGVVGLGRLKKESPTP